MSETPQQYTDRILNHVAELNPMDALKSNLSALKELFQALERKGSLNKTLGAQWNPLEILAHLAEAEIVWGYRIRKVLGDSGVSIHSYDQNSWVKNCGYLQADPHLALSLFEIVRRANIALLKSLTSEQMEYFGMHSVRGKESISHIVKMMAGHDINHLKQMETISKS